MIATLAEVLAKAKAGNYAVAGLVVLGWEDACAFAKAGAEEGLPVILQAGPGCRTHTPLSVLGAMFRHLAETTPIPVVAHLDHSTSLDECRAAIEAGFSSVMYDGSSLPLEHNIRETAKVVAMARAAGVSVEGEVGFVGYDGAKASTLTCPEDARRMAEESGVDALAVSVGNVHLQRTQKADIDFEALARIEAVTRLPLVLHGGSGIPGPVRRKLARDSAVCKFNVGTELRQAFGAALRQGLARHPERFDRIAILKEAIDPLVAATRGVIAEIGRPSL